jgi:hypothetical protein
MNGRLKERIKRCTKAFQDKSGVSLMFVLAIMLLLMAIGISVVTAAGQNFGASLAQRDRNQLDLYVSSMERTLRAVLVESAVGETMSGSTVDSMTGRILREAYQNVYPSTTGSYNVNMTLSSESPDGDAEYDIVITGTIYVTITLPVETWEYITDDPDDPDAEPVLVLVSRTPLSATASGTINVMLTTRYEAPVRGAFTPNTGGGLLSTRTVTTYRYNGAVIEELLPLSPADPVVDTNLLINYSGIWTVYRHERTA